MRVLPSRWNDIAVDLCGNLTPISRAAHCCCLAWGKTVGNILQMRSLRFCSSRRFCLYLSQIQIESCEDDFRYKLWGCKCYVCSECGLRGYDTLGEYRRFGVNFSLALKMEVVSSSETLVSTYNTTGCQKPEDRNLENYGYWAALQRHKLYSLALYMLNMFCFI
jgi:hypothetical protein